MSWLAPGFLAGLLLLGIPWWLHRRESRSPDRESFPSVMLFRESAKRLLVAKRIQHRWLLAVRLALLTILALLFAEPMLNRNATPTDNTPAALLIVDDSASMRGLDLTALARRVMATAPTAMQWYVASQRISLQNLSTSEALTAVANITPGYARIDFGSLMRAAVNQVPAGTPTYVVTDAQATAVPANFADLLPAGVGKVTLSSIPDERRNAWISAITVDDEAAVATVSGASANAQVIWRLANSVVATTTVTAGRAQLSLPDLAGEQYALSAELLQDDALGVDNMFYAVVDRSPPMVVPILTNPNSAALPFFRAALATLPQRMAAQPVPIAEFDIRTASRYRWIVVEDPDALSAAQVQGLAQFVDGGGRLLLMAGASESVEPAAALHGMQVVRMVDDGPGVVAADFAHPLLGHAPSWRSVGVFRHTEVTLSAEHQVVVALTSGAPLVVTRQLGRGEVIALATRLDNLWSDLGSRAAFVGLAQAIAEQITGDLGESRLLAGRPLPERLGTQVIAPDGRRIEAATDGAIQLDIPGIYTVYSEAGTNLVPVNVDRREADLAVMTDTLMARWQQARPAARPAGARNPGESDDSQTQQRPIWPLLLILLMVMMMLEPTLANLTRSALPRTPEARTSD